MISMLWSRLPRLKAPTRSAHSKALRALYIRKHRAVHSAALECADNVSTLKTASSRGSAERCKVRTPYYITSAVGLLILAAASTTGWAANSKVPGLHGRNDYYTLYNSANRKVQARILYVGDHWIYLKRSSKDPQRIELSQLREASRGLAREWKTEFEQTLTPKELRTVMQTAAEASISPQPLVLDPDPTRIWTLDEQFSDEFSNRTIDEDKWYCRMRPWGERAWSPDNLWIKNDRLFIQARYEPHRDRKGREFFYKLGIIQSQRKTTYGYFEARIKGCSRFPGLCPAFWLYSNGRELNPDYPHITYCEIDIVEMLQNTYIPGKPGGAGPEHLDLNLHTRELIDGVETWRRPQSWSEVCRHHWQAPWDPRDDFHLYACENTPEKITWYIDGIKVAEEENHNWHLPMNVTLTMELRPPLIRWAGVDGREPVPEASTRDGFPTHMEVDYVRVWTHAGTPVETE